MSVEHLDKVPEGLHSPLIGRRSVLAGGSATALGVTSMLLPTAASATSPGGQGGGSTFGIIASSSYTDLDASGAVLFRSFTYGTNRYFVDLVNGQLIAFGATGAHIETLTITGAPLGFSDPFNQDSDDTRAITSFVVVGDAAYAAYLQRRAEDDVDLAAFDLKVLRLTLDVDGGETTVTAATKTTDLNALWNARFPALDNDDYRALDVYRQSALVAEGTNALHMLLSSEISFGDASANTTTRTRYLDRFVIPIGADWENPVGAPDLLDSESRSVEEDPDLSLGSFNTVDGVAVPPSNPTHALFFDEETSDGVLVPFSRDSPGWSSRALSVPEGVGTISFINQLGGLDRTMATDGNILYAAGGVDADGTDRVAMLRFDLSAIISQSELTVTSAVVVPNSVGSPTALSREGSTVYIAIGNSFDYFTPSSPDFRADGYVARFQTDPPSWLSTATVGISAVPPWHFPLTVQAVSTGVLSGGVGGVGGTAEEDRGFGDAAAPLVVLVGGST
jgi:hypothetical protein